MRPDIAVISNIGDAHIEHLGSREGILKAKSEIFENLKPEGLAVLNGDDALLNTLDLPFRDRPLRPVGALRRPGDRHGRPRRSGNYLHRRGPPGTPIT